jgi:Uncharacterized conserved protein
MRPDCSLHIQPRTRTPQLADPGDLDLWLHFDAKYRVEYLREQFDASSGLDEEAAGEAESIERLSRSKREDLLKMHAYRDAIRRTAVRTCCSQATRTSRRTANTASFFQD